MSFDVSPSVATNRWRTSCPEPARRDSSASPSVRMAPIMRSRDRLDRLYSRRSNSRWTPGRPGLTGAFMLPRLFSLEWGLLAFHLNGYGFSILCGSTAALLILLRRARAVSIPVQPLLWLVMLSVAGGFAGAR